MTIVPSTASSSGTVPGSWCVTSLINLDPCVCIFIESFELKNFSLRNEKDKILIYTGVFLSNYKKNVKSASVDEI